MNKITDRLKLGALGELLVQLRLLEFDVQAAPPLKDSGNDLIAPIVYKKCRIPSFLKEKVWAEMGGRRYREGLAMIIERLREMENGS